MNIDDRHRVEDSDGRDALARRLHGLRRDIAPHRDLWPEVAVALPARAPAQAVAQVAPPTVPAGRYRRRRGLLPALAVAASLVLVAGLALRGQAGGDTVAPVLHAEAVAMGEEYQAALASLERAPVQPEMQPGLDELDRSAAQILEALHEHPHGRLLFDQLRRTYDRRLELTRRAIIT